MSKSANAGELRTMVYFKEVNRSTNDRGYPVENEVNIFGENVAVYCKWVNAHGSEVFTAMQMQLREPATITCRFSPAINQKQLVYRAGDPKPYEIISIDNVMGGNTWMEIKVQRKAAAK